MKLVTCFSQEIWNTEFLCLVWRTEIDTLRLIYIIGYKIGYFQVKVSLQNDMPLPTPRKNVTIFPCVTYRVKVPNQSRYHSCDSNFQGTYGLDEQTFPVPADGLVDVTLTIPEDAVSVTITVKETMHNTVHYL